MPRQLINDKNWANLKPILLEQGIYDKPDLRQTLEGMFYRVRVGWPWQDLPKYFGPWNKVYKPFRPWCQSGTWLSIFKAAIEDADLAMGFY